MLSSLILVFREVLEAALIISIVSAATREVAGSRRWILYGVTAGVFGAGLVALLADRIGAMAEGLGLELFNAGVLIAAVAMIGWHVIWMASHGRELAKQMREVGSAVAEGSRTLYALMIVVALAVLREGSEVVLFLYGVSLGGTDTMNMLAGSLAGVAIGAGLGYALYRGMLRIPMRYFFTATNGLLLLLAAGLAAQAAGFLNQADVVPAFGQQLWDTDWLLSEQSVFGQTLHTLVGYQSRPMGVQVLAYAATLFTLIIGMKRWGSKSAATAARA